MPSDRELPKGDRAEEPEPMPAETFSQRIRRIAHEKFGMPLDAEPAKPMPRSGGLQGDARVDAIFRGEDPNEREPGEDDGD